MGLAFEGTKERKFSENLVVVQHRRCVPHSLKKHWEEEREMGCHQFWMDHPHMVCHKEESGCWSFMAGLKKGHLNALK